MVESQKFNDACLEEGTIVFVKLGPKRSHSILNDAAKSTILNSLNFLNASATGHKVLEKICDNWLIFSLPPAEIAFHPSDDNNHHEFYFTCDDIENFTVEMKNKGIKCSEITDQGWGLLSEITLPGGGRLGIYEPRHAPKKVNTSRL